MVARPAGFTSDPDERSLFTYYPGMSGINPRAAAVTRNRNHTITAWVHRPDDRAEGAILAMGGRFAGWTLFVKDNLLVYEYNYVELERYVVTSRSEVPVGSSVLQMRFDLTGRLQGTAALLVDGSEVGRGEIPRTCPVTTGLEPLDCGQDTQTPVSGSYQSPFRFSGTIDRVEVEVRGRRPRADTAGDGRVALGLE